MSKTAYVLVAVGVEELEILIIISILRQAGIKVTSVGLLGDSPIKCKNKLVIKPDKSLEAVKNDVIDILILPGGLPATKAMQDSELLAEVLIIQEKEGRLIAAIGTSPIVLEHHAIFKGRRLTSHASFKEALIKGGYHFIEVSNVVKDGNLITGCGLGASFEFALRVACIFTEPGNTKQIAKMLLLSDN
ncbi:PARK7.2 family protein [Megaselia abdita]